MEVSVLNIKGQETGRKVTLNEAIFGIEPNDHVLYLDVKQYLANQRQGTAKSKERSEIWTSEGWRRCPSWRYQLTSAAWWWSCVWSYTS